MKATRAETSRLVKSDQKTPWRVVGLYARKLSCSDNSSAPSMGPNDSSDLLSSLHGQRAGDQSRQRRQPNEGSGINNANDGNARAISRQLGHNSQNFHENNPNFRRAIVQALHRDKIATRPAYSRRPVRTGGPIEPVACPDQARGGISPAGRDLGRYTSHAPLPALVSRALQSVEIPRARTRAYRHLWRARASLSSHPRPP